MKWLIIIFSLIELLGVILQYNDPDPVFWMVVYGIPLVLNLVYLGGKKLRTLNMIVFVAYVVYFLTFISLGSFEIILSFKNVMIGLGVASAIGTLAGVIPAGIAAKLDPVIAIRTQ